MTEKESDTDSSEYKEVVPVSVLEGLFEGWRTKVSRHDFDGNADEYRGYMEAHESCAEDIETVIRDMATETKQNPRRNDD